MKTSKLALLAALLSACAAAPALADWDNIGSVHIDFRNDRDSQAFNLGGPVERLQLTADRSDINCRSVRADYGDSNNGRGNGRGRDRYDRGGDRGGFGRGDEIFRGQLQAGRPANIDLPGNGRVLRSLTFNCGAQEQRGGTIRITADIGRYRDDWRRSPDWQNTWSRTFNWGSNALNNWQLIGSESFQGRDDRESSFAGWRGQRTDAVALKPLEADARCSQVTARFQQGQPQNLNVNNGDLLRQGQYYKLDLPGNMRNLQSLSLRCRAQGARGVTMQIFVSK